MVLVLSQSQLLEMEAHAERVYPEECCGLILGTTGSAHDAALKSVVEIVSLENEWPLDSGHQPGSGHQPSSGQTSSIQQTGEIEHSTQATRRRRYSIDPKDMLRVQKQARDAGLNIIGIYHSHPESDAVPSECDRAGAWSQYAYVIVSVCNGKAVDIQNWALDFERQFQPEAIRISPSSPRDRMPVSA